MMKTKSKPILQLLVIEFFICLAFMPKTGNINMFFADGTQWKFAYMLIGAAIYFAMCLKKPVQFGIAFSVCTVAGLLIHWQVTLCTIPVAVLLWVLNNYINPINCEEISDKDKAAWRRDVNIVYIAAALVFFVIMIIVIFHSPTLRISKKFFWIPWPPYLIYLCYSLIYKSSFSFSPKAKKFIGKIKESLF